MGRLDNNIQYLKGVGNKRAELLRKELGIRSFGDLLWHLPLRYIDKSTIYNIADVSEEMPYIQIKGKITNFRTEGAGAKTRLIGTFIDDTGMVELVWFRGHKWVKESILPDTEYVIFGKPNRFRNTINIVHPEVEDRAKKSNDMTSGFEPVYPTTENLKKNYITSRALKKLFNTLFRELAPEEFTETLPPYILEKLSLPSFAEAMQNIHFPEDTKKLQKARFRLKFEELFYIQLNILKQKTNKETHYEGFVFSQVGESFYQFYYNNLPFSLTGAQKRVLKEMRKDMHSGRQMNRLLQGDVGSGKTLVALMCALIAIDNNFQTALMAPTEILAQQHFETISDFLKGLSVNIRLLTGSTKKSQRNIIHEELRNGELNILVGTHALIEDTVQFYNLGLVIIDEQHRFGVAQRAKLWEKNVHPPHIIVMTATPIPRTLSMTIYGDLDVSVIDELPPGRKPIKTAHATDAQRLRVFKFIRDEIAKGRQIYIVYPLIYESDKMNYKDLEEGYESITRAFPPPEYNVSILHGQMKPTEKERSMQLFASGQAQILVSTTVIEVGVDVSNATVMIIESAERFGLSQLHQLRGRVGRGGEQSYCILMTPDKISDDAKKRIKTMVSTNDGFKLAEEDMKLRGPGDIEGTQQSGIPFDLKIANLSEDGQTLELARKIASEILKDDPELTKNENVVLKKQLENIAFNKIDWSDVS